ncbi:MAG: hypothetical protein MPJ50_07900 [Pirellulales bacterium]|nr:hypothetical protein [Pirellulales bacterium]
MSRRCSAERLWIMLLLLSSSSPAAKEGKSFQSTLATRSGSASKPAPLSAIG